MRKPASVLVVHIALAITGVIQTATGMILVFGHNSPHFLTTQMFTPLQILAVGVASLLLAIGCFGLMRAINERTAFTRLHAGCFAFVSFVCGMAGLLFLSSGERPAAIAAIVVSVFIPFMLRNQQATEYFRGVPIPLSPPPTFRTDL
ncbi:MAG TPA: hypothetical protein VLE99_01620 [Candidatus Saccharimonadales bacterium]|nr:hypothetical protein [Candidatus Saccharimonadales bacterium]